MNQTSQYQYVTCEVCGADQPMVLFEIDRVSKVLVALNNGYEAKFEQPLTIVRCQQCGLIYVNPRVHLETGVMPYSDEAEAAYFQNTYAQRAYASRRLVERFPDWFGGQKPARLLDIGSGDGVLLEACERAGIDFVGLEVSTPLVEQLRERYGERIRYAEELSSLPSASFDVITLINVIEHLEKPGEMVAEAHRLLRPGGIFLVHAPNMGGIPARLRGKAWHQIHPLVHLYYFTPTTLKRLLKKGGLEPIGRFSLLSLSPMKKAAQKLSDRFEIYLDNGLGVAARRE